MALLAVENLSISIKRRQETHAITHGITFSINAGEITALVGESGSGKTLTALSVMRLLPPNAQITSGKILWGVGGVDVHTADEKTLCCIRGKEIAMVFQEPRSSLNPLMRVGAQIAEALELRGTGKKAAGTAALDILQELKFAQPELIYNAWPHQLSGGMCQRVMIAIAAINRPRLIIADEPTSALDAQNQNRIIALLEQVNREYGTAILFITHDLSLAQRFCSRSLVMHEGKIVDEEFAFSQGAGRPPSRPPGKTILSIRNVSNTYISRSFGLFGKKEVKPVLRSINLDVGAGEIFGLTGESGAGKSTLARCIVGLTGYEGDIVMDGRAQMVFQDPGISLNPVKKIGWLMEEPLVIHRRGDAAQRARKADEMLARVGLDPRIRTRRITELSGGQKQRVCIGRALMLEPHILIADEAISSLDVFAGAQILSLFRELRDTLGLTIIFISHNNYAVEHLCDRVAVMENGVIHKLFKKGI